MKAGDSVQRVITSWEQVPVVMDLELACIILGRGYDALKKDAREGRFPAFKNGVKKWAVTKEDLLTYIERQKRTTPLT